MKLSVSNIGWAAEQDAEVYARMRKAGFTGLEIAPTRIFPTAPYSDLQAARDWAADLGFAVPSMQSIWFGRSESIFGTAEDRTALLNYTKQAIDFAEAIGCKNLVFGCPRNRNVPEGMTMAEAMEIAVPFFKALGDYAAAHQTVLSMEANPPIYNTNFCNTTADALALVQQVRSPGFLLNLDVGTMVHNEESPELLRSKAQYVNHVHISEPHLKPIARRSLHHELLAVLKAEDYDNFLSIEMGKQEDLTPLFDALSYLGKELTA